MNHIRIEKDAMPSASDWPERFRDLDEAGLLIVGCLRHWHAGLRHERSLHFEVVARELIAALQRPDGLKAFTAVAASFKLMLRSARHTLDIHLPCCPKLGDDETRVLAMVGCCQANRFLAARLMAESLVEDGAVGDLLGRMSDLGVLVGRHGLRIALPGDAVLEAVSAPGESGLWH